MLPTELFLQSLSSLQVSTVYRVLIHRLTSSPELRLTCQQSSRGLNMPHVVRRGLLGLNTLRCRFMHLIYFSAFRDPARPAADQLGSKLVCITVILDGGPSRVVVNLPYSV